MLHYYIIYKPYQVQTQFSPIDGKKTLRDFFTVPQDVYPVGRLDADSEGLLILTNDKQLNHRLLNPRFAHEREYWVQVDGDITPDALYALQNGMPINVDGKIYTTQKCKSSLLESLHHKQIPERMPPIRYRKSVPAPWIKLVLTEGKNRQVRKMTASVGFPTLRLIRHRIEKISLEGMQPGDMVKLSQQEIYRLLFGHS